MAKPPPNFLLSFDFDGTLVNHSGERRPPALPLLGALPPAACAGQTLLGCVRHDWDRGRLVMEPVALITAQHVIRLGY